ncbi:MAG: hypothetical protein AAFQ24_13030 [Pseudomonadota bacterium]
MKKRKTHQKGYERQPPTLGDDHQELYELPRVEFDIEKYRPYLEDESLTPEQATALLTALWQIMTSFVDLGFNIHPVQQACGQINHDADCNPAGTQNALQSSIQDFMNELKRGVETCVEEDSI